jgi:hypothetical protein
VTLSLYLCIPHSETAMETCGTCGFALPRDAAVYLGLVDPLRGSTPREARCRRDHGRHVGCLFAATIPGSSPDTRNRGPWVASVFTPLPVDEAEAMRRYSL